jgi:AcrR family transcriptional regulator
MTAETYQRARRPEQKLERRDAILAAARDLALRDGVRAVSLADIAARVGIHKSALLRYFETREQIFLELTAQAWREWTAALHAELAPAPGPAADAGRSQYTAPLDTAPLDTAPLDTAPPDVASLNTTLRDSVLPDATAGGDAASVDEAAWVADVFARSFSSRPLLCDLVSHTPLNLERNVSVEAVRRYKLTSLGAVEEAATLVRGVLPALTQAECVEFVSAIASLAGAVWQMANPGSALADLYAADPAFSRACIDLAARLRRTGEILLAGLIPSRAAAR